MPGLPRFQLPGVPQHIILRGNNREACFFEQADYTFYLESLREAADRYGCRIHAYVLMTNHIHLLMTPCFEDAVSSMMQSAGCRYVKYVNRHHDRTGSLWEGRYKASLVESKDYLLACYRYIELNPVRAMMVSHPGEYPWSSYHVNALGESSGLVSAHEEYLRLGINREQRMMAYRELLEQPLEQVVTDEIRTAVNQQLVTGRNAFKHDIAIASGRRTDHAKPGRPKK
jgi:putative transposase